MNNQIGVAADRTREMQIVRLGQTVMTERLGRVTRPLQTLEQAYFEGLLFGLAADRSEKALHFFAIGKITDFVAEAQNEFAVFAELLRIGSS